MIRRTFIIIALPLLFGLTTGCKSDDSKQPTEKRVTEVTEARDALTEELMLALGQAKNFHGKADVYIKNGDVDKAITEVERVLTIQFPTGSPEGEDVLLDGRARLAKLLLGKGDVARARDIVDKGLAAASRESFFVANLHTVKGELIEAEAAELEKTDAGAAKKLRLKAIREYDESIRINEKLQKKLAAESGN